MSDLQIGLAMLGVLVVASVFAFNWWQERQFRRKGQDAFASRHDDVLLEQAAAPPPAPVRPPAEEQRIEPRIEPHLEAVAAEPVPVAAPEAMQAEQPEPQVDYVAEIRAGEYVAAEHVADLQQTLARLGRRVNFSGFDHQSRTWRPLALEEDRFTSVRAALQLVDRSGPVTEEQLQFFGEAVRDAAHRMAAIAELPEYATALRQAAGLDEFCADVDVVVGINVIARAGQGFHGTKIRALAEASGFLLRDDGVFEAVDEHGATLFTLDNQEPAPFLADKIRGMTTRGITFLLDVPRVANGIKAFDRMLAAGRAMAESLDGILADDNGVALNDAGLEKIRDQLRAIYGTMEQRGIHPGSPLALRLFS